MTNNYRSYLITALLSMAFVVLFSECKKKTQTTPDTSADNTFDKQAMLVNYADNVIIPSYKAFKNAVDSLQQSVASFKSTQSLSAYQQVKSQFYAAYLRYQTVGLFGFGPGEDLNIRSNCNVFPCNTVQINNNVNSGAYDLSMPVNLSAKGFPALDYLIYGSAQDENQMLAMWTSDSNRFQYAEALVSDLVSKANTLLTNWQNNYRSTFINSLGTDLGSSIGFMVNQLNYELDFLKNYKLAVPLGLKSGGTVMPDNCEGFFGTQSLAYAFNSLNAIENMYLGRSPGGSDGKGFDDYLQHLKVMHVSSSLHEAITAQFERAKSQLLAIANPLSQQVITHPAQVKAAHDELVKLLVLLKTDMPSALGVIITYQDGDGD